MKSTIATTLGAAALLALVVSTAASRAETPPIKIGITLSTTGASAALGIPEKNTLELVTREIAGVKLELTVLDDGGDPTAATTNARRFATEDKVDILIGSSVTPASMAVNGVAHEVGIPAFLISPVPFPPGRDKWGFSVPAPVPMIAKGLFDDMVKRKIKTVGYIGFSDGWGDLWMREFKAQAEPLGIKLTTDERYARSDTSVSGQALKLVAGRPDAILVGASGTAAALPSLALRERGFAGPIYQTNAAVTRDFLRIAGKSAEGTILVSGPAVMAPLLPADHPSKALATKYMTDYEAKFGVGTTTLFGASMYDIFEMLKQVVPVALKAGAPGTPEFRDALRVALESGDGFIGSDGVYTYRPKDHYGMDERGRVMIIVKKADWALLD